MNKQSDETKMVEILWTGGFDSTFRIIQLSRLNIVIKPYYINNKRNSYKYELKAICNITEKLKIHPKTKCTFNPLTIVELDSGKAPELKEAYERILENGDREDERYVHKDSGRDI